LFVEENDNLQMGGFVYIVFFSAEGVLGAKNNGDCFCFMGLLGLNLSTWHLVAWYFGHETIATVSSQTYILYCVKM
jgi:hypothetical protein